MTTILFWNTCWWDSCNRVRGAGWHPLVPDTVLTEPPGRYGRILFRAITSRHEGGNRIKRSHSAVNDLELVVSNCFVMEIIEKSEQLNLEKELLAPYRHLVRAQKKLLASRVFWAFNHWLNVPEDLFLPVKDCMTVMINGIIMIDDIQDDSLVRHGFPTAHCVYGMPLTLNTGLQVIAESMKNVVDLMPNGLGCKLFAEQLHEIMVGQGTEIYWRDNFVCPTEEQYKKMQQQKTGGYIKLGVKLLQALSDDKRNYDYFVQLLAYYSQLLDDYCNLCAKELNQEGAFCEDITEGKFTLPLIHASKTSAGPEIFHILRKRTRDVDLKKHCLSLLEKTGSLQYTRDRLSKLDREARAELARLGDNPEMENVLKELNSWKEDRMCL